MKLKIFQLVFFCLIILSGCSIKETVKNTTDQETLRERGAMYWGYLCKQQFDKAYEYEYPVYRKTVGIVDYIRRFRSDVKWTGVAIDNVQVTDDTAMVKVKVDTEVKMAVSRVPKRIEVKEQIELSEKWIKVGGVWYHVPQSFKGADKGADKEV